jgi:hypothetical protein
MSRGEAVGIVQSYLLREPVNQELYFRWLGVSREAFYYLLDQFRNPDYWLKDSGLNWKYLDPAGYLGDKRTNTHNADSFADFTLTERGKSTDKKDNFVIFGKGTV